MNVQLKARTAFHLMLLVAVIAVTGCASTVYMESKKGLDRFHGGPQPVYVTNPELHREYDILRASGIYQISPKADGTRSLTLRPIRQFPRCGNPLMLTIFTLGLVPGYLPGAYAFEYDFQTDGVRELYTHHLPLYERFSAWEWLMIRSEKNTFAMALAWSIPERKPGPTE